MRHRDFKSGRIAFWIHNWAHTTVDWMRCHHLTMMCLEASGHQEYHATESLACLLLINQVLCLFFLSKAFMIISIHLHKLWLLAFKETFTACHTIQLWVKIWNITLGWKCIWKDLFFFSLSVCVHMTKKLLLPVQWYIQNCISLMKFTYFFNISLTNFSD